MKRLKDSFLSRLNDIVPLSGSTILEIGCGDGSRSVGFANLSKELYAIDPEDSLIRKAKDRNIPNATFDIGVGQHLNYINGFFDIVIFSLSFHHIPKQDMEGSIQEAIRVVKKGGFIIFFEPTEDGTFFDAEILFDACDGDEILAKRNAHLAIQNISDMRQVSEFYDETVFEFSSGEDFIESLNPKKNIDEILDFLTKNNFLLNAERRVNVFQSV